MGASLLALAKSIYESLMYHYKTRKNYSHIHYDITYWY